MQEAISDDLIRTLLDQAVTRLGLNLLPQQLQQLAAHFSLLLRWNQKINLTSLRRPQEIASRHFEESLFLTKITDIESGLLVDVGSGAGFPGLPIKVARPGLRAILLEPNQKKTAFLKEAVRACKLTGVDVLALRLEEALSAPADQVMPLTHKANLVTVRAVAPTLEFLSCLKQLLHPQGQLALFLGEQDALSIAATSGFSWNAPVKIPNSERRVILVGKLDEKREL
ncbi:MAG: 16S rRNA (guanine(527)-N(7))-methyltransferase RsmG [Acidobacteria bacterium RIFCSPLOWO2_12_FULL_54_10]|nr:MAG: 16S rRNA (guanine(527)-N(7))-methyltransferase RsmG [Acidobacteria bacterium RIFCSPLOWO2_12_FULL_54_10]